MGFASMGEHLVRSMSRGSMHDDKLYLLGLDIFLLPFISFYSYNMYV
jgi:hypothetical protein